MPLSFHRSCSHRFIVINSILFQIAKLEFSENVFDWKTRGFTSWNTAVDGQCKLFWTLQQYFVDKGNFHNAYLLKTTLPWQSGKSISTLRLQIKTNTSKYHKVSYLLLTVKPFRNHLSSNSNTFTYLQETI